MSKRVLTIDPSGTGTTGFFYKEFLMSGTKTFESEEWLDHYNFIINEIKWNRYDIVVIEGISSIGRQQASKHLVDLAKLIGALELYLQYAKDKVVWVDSFSTKRLMKKLKTLDFEQQCLGIKKTKIGRRTSYRYDFRDLSRHEIDSIALYQIYKDYKNYIEMTKVKKEKK